jgi:hypothetical protein
MRRTFWPSIAVIASLSLAFTAGAQAHGGGGGGGGHAFAGSARGGAPSAGFRGGNPGVRMAPGMNINPGFRGNEGFRGSEGVRENGGVGGNEGFRGNEGSRGVGGRPGFAPVPGSGYSYPFSDDPYGYNPYLDNLVVTVPEPVPVPVPDDSQGETYQSAPCNVWQVGGDYSGSPVVAVWAPLQAGYYYTDPNTGAAVLISTWPDSCSQ